MFVLSLTDMIVAVFAVVVCYQTWLFWAEDQKSCFLEKISSAVTYPYRHQQQQMTMIVVMIMIIVIITIIKNITVPVIATFISSTSTKHIGMQTELKKSKATARSV